MSDYQSERRGRISISLRPFNKGIILDASPTMLPKGALINADGYISTTSGIARRRGMQTIETFIPPDVSRYDYIDSFINDDGTKTTYAIADGKFYELGGSTFIPRPCEYRSTDDSPDSTISATAGSTIITGIDTTFTTQQIIAGDVLIVDPEGLETIYTVNSVSSDTTITVLESISDDFTGVAFTIQRRLYPAPEWQVTVARIDRLLYICTGSRPLLCYNIDDPDRVTPLDTERPFIPKTVLVFNDRLWCGNIYIPANYPGNPDPSRWYTNRVSWSLIINTSGYTPTTVGAIDIDPRRNFNDLIEIGGEISALASLGSYMALFFEFGIQYGRETSIPGDTLPLAFDIIPSGRRGVLQPGAVASSKNGIFYVSTDSIYFLGVNLQVDGVSDKINSGIFRPQILNTRYKIVNFNESDGIVIGCGYNEDSYDEFWVYNLESRGWTKFNYACAYFNVFSIGTRLIYGDYPNGQVYGVEPSGQNDDALGNILPDSPSLGTLVPVQPPVDLPQYPLTDYTDSKAIYAGENADQTNDRFYATVGANVNVMESEYESDQNSSPIICTIETGDFDFDQPDRNKTIYRLAMRLFNTAPVDIVYSVQGSLNSGVDWYDLGELFIYSGGKEGKCNFQFTGSAPRFRLVSSSLSSSYEIIEMTLDVKGRGKQFSDT